MSTHPVENPRAETRSAPHRGETDGPRLSGGTSRRRDDTPTTRSPGSCAPPSSTTSGASPSSSSTTSRCPSTWSQTATNIVASKYFRGQLGSPEREKSVRSLISRVVDTIRSWAEAQGYFATPEDLQAFCDELTHLLVQQKAAFNSPVWFNVGIEKHPQASACFINSVARHDGVDPRPRPHRGHALQVRLGHGLEPLEHPLLAGSPSPAAAPPPARSRSCAATTPSPA